MTGVPLNLGSTAVLDRNQYSAGIRAVVRTRSMNNVLHDLLIIRSEDVDCAVRNAAKREEEEARCGTARQMATNETCNRKDRKGSAKVAKKPLRLRTRNFLNCALIFFAYLAAFLRDLRG